MQYYFVDHDGTCQVHLQTDMSINLTKDEISLYANAHGISRDEAAVRLAQQEITSLCSDAAQAYWE